MKETGKTTNDFKVIVHASREENLLAAKRALRRTRGSHMNRRYGEGEEIIDVVVGCEVKERHVCHVDSPAPAPVPGRRFCVEELALYR